MHTGAAKPDGIMVTMAFSGCFNIKLLLPAISPGGYK
jgi:hypothetical protein